MDNWVEIINEFLVQAQKGDLKTSSYPKEWDGLKMKVSFGMGAPRAHFVKKKREIAFVLGLATA